MTVILELRQPLWMKTPKGEALAILLTDYGPESDHLWTCIQQEGEHQGELWTWHNSEVRVLPNSSMLRRGASELSEADKRELRKPPPDRVIIPTPPEIDQKSWMVSDPLAPSFGPSKFSTDRTIGDVIKQVKDEAEWATSTQQPPMRSTKGLHLGDLVPQGYRKMDLMTRGQTILLRLDLPDSYPDEHPDEIPK